MQYQQYPNTETSVGRKESYIHMHAKAKEIALVLEYPINGTMVIQTTSSDTVHNMTEKNKTVSK